MNSLYSTIENQQLLWEMINKTPLIHTHFPPNHSESISNKEKWFLSILNEFHQKNPNIYKKDDLLQMNRSTLSHLMNGLKKMNNDKPNLPKQIENDLNSRYTRIEPRSNAYTNSYEERQKEYDSMLRGVLQTPVQFEKIEDKKIQNITELTEQYRKSRELDVPLPLKLHEPLPEKEVKEVLNVIDVTKKHIHWADSFTEISNLHEQIKLLKSRMDDLENKYSSHEINHNDMVERIQKIAFENTENAENAENTENTENTRNE